MSLQDFIKLVESMRQAQENYFRARRSKDHNKAQEALQESKALEAKVDAAINNYKHGQTGNLFS